jgi:hypothetical protein
VGQHKRTVFESRFSSDVHQHCKYSDFTRSVRFAKIGGSFLPELEMQAADDYPTDFVHKEASAPAALGRTREGLIDD